VRLARGRSPQLPPIDLLPSGLHLKSARARRAPQIARVHGQRALDVGCVPPARGGISCTVRQRLRAVSMALDVRLVAVPGWVFVVLDEPHFLIEDCFCRVATGHCLEPIGIVHR
jgi:hypothetical protein